MSWPNVSCTHINTNMILLSCLSSPAESSRTAKCWANIYKREPSSPVTAQQCDDYKSLKTIKVIRHSHTFQTRGGVSTQLAAGRGAEASWTETRKLRLLLSTNNQTRLGFVSVGALVLFTALHRKHTGSF